MGIKDIFNTVNSFDEDSSNDNRKVTELANKLINNIEATKNIEDSSDERYSKGYSEGYSDGVGRVLLLLNHLSSEEDLDYDKMRFIFDTLRKAGVLR